MSRDVEITVDLNRPRLGARTLYPVKVDWPELQLTENQIVANAFARANGEDVPFPDQSIFTVSVRFVGDE
jgi:hypothetical protein